MDGREAFKKIQTQLRRAANQRGGGNFSGGPGGLFAGGGLVVALLAGGIALNASLFNVDGGHRAIKYTRLVLWRFCISDWTLTLVLHRLHGIKDQVFNEGTHFAVSDFTSCHLPTYSRIA